MENTDHNKLLIAHVLGYILKVLKNEKKLTAFKQEFASIRHGNYHQFHELVKAEIPFMVIYNNGHINNNVTTIEGECDFVGLLASGQALRKFEVDCKTHYGDINDSDFADEVYRKLVVFEIAIRMHANNHNLISTGDKLEMIINELSKVFPLSDDEIETLHKGRKFLNRVKHPEKNKDDLWKSNVSEFESAYSILGRHRIKVI